MYLLLGDSQFLRMNNNFPFPSSVTICLAVSGATIVQTNSNPWIKGIFQDFLENNTNLEKINVTVFVMGGTNDFLRGVDLKSFQRAYKSLLRLVRKYFSKIVVCPPPPIPKLGIDGLKTLRACNQWFLSLVPTVNTVDSFCAFINPSDKNPDMSLFEHTFTYHDGCPDLIHLNELGLFVLKHLLITIDKEIRSMYSIYGIELSTCVEETNCLAESSKPCKEEDEEKHTRIVIMDKEYKDKTN